MNWKKLIKKPLQHQDYKRLIYPTIWEGHFTHVVLDLPVTGRVGRAVFLDPMQEYHPHITNAFSSWFKFRNLLDMSWIHVHGGIQKDNVTECGIFALLNLDVLLKTKTFFTLADWKQDSVKRDVSKCFSARIEYAAIMRQHIIQYICSDEPFDLPQSRQQLPPQPLTNPGKETNQRKQIHGDMREQKLDKNQRKQAFDAMKEKKLAKRKADVDHAADAAAADSSVQVFVIMSMCLLSTSLPSIRTKNLSHLPSKLLQKLNLNRNLNLNINTYRSRIMTGFKTICANGNCNCDFFIVFSLFFRCDRFAQRCLP